MSNFSSSDKKDNDTENSNSTSKENGSGEYKENSDSHHKTNNSSSAENRKSNSGIPEFDLNTILKIKSIMDSLNNSENDSRSNLLLSLKPYLSDHKKDKIDQYVKFLRLAKVFETLNPMGGDSSTNE